VQDGNIYLMSLSYHGYHALDKSPGRPKLILTDVWWVWTVKMPEYLPCCGNVGDNQRRCSVAMVESKEAVPPNDNGDQVENQLVQVLH
jgi:hypothetical protein